MIMGFMIYHAIPINFNVSAHRHMRRLNASKTLWALSIRSILRSLIQSRPSLDILSFIVYLLRETALIRPNRIRGGSYGRGFGIWADFTGCI